MGSIMRSRIYPVICFFIIPGLLACKKNNIPQHISQANQTVKLESGKVDMYGNHDFFVSIPALEVQQYEVTNAAFAQFVKNTGYITTAEKTHEGMVFDRSQRKWILEKGADWKHPQGASSTIEDRDFYPVVQVSYADACAYC